MLTTTTEGKSEIHLNRCSVLETKIWGIYHGLSIIWGHGHHSVIIESDSYQAIKLLSEGDDFGHPLFDVVRGILAIADEEYETQRKKSNREASCVVLVQLFWAFRPCGYQKKRRKCVR